MKKIICILGFIGISTTWLAAYDAATPEGEKAGELWQVRRFFEVITKMEASEKNIKNVLLGANQQESAVKFAVEAYALGTTDSPDEKRLNILKCAREHEDSDSILYECAVALEPSRESLEWYKEILRRNNANQSSQLLSLWRLIQLGVIPSETVQLLLNGFWSPSKMKFSNEIYEQLKIHSKTSQEAAQYLKQIDELKSFSKEEVISMAKEAIGDKLEIPDNAKVKIIIKDNNLIIAFERKYVPGMRQGDYYAQVVIDPRKKNVLQILGSD